MGEESLNTAVDENTMDAYTLVLQLRFPPYHIPIPLPTHPGDPPFHLLIHQHASPSQLPKFPPCTSPQDNPENRTTSPQTLKKPPREPLSKLIYLPALHRSKIVPPPFPLCLDHDPLPTAISKSSNTCHRVLDHSRFSYAFTNIAAFPLQDSRAYTTTCAKTCILMVS